MSELPCKFNPTGIVCDGATLCSFCGWNPQEAKRRKSQLRAQTAEKPRCIVKNPGYEIEDWTGPYDPR